MSIRKCSPPGPSPHFRLAGTALLALWLIGAASAAEIEPINLEYKMSFAGISVATMKVEAEISPTAYSIESESRSRGVIGWVAKFKSESLSVGIIEDDSIVPVRHVAKNSFRGKERLVELEYAGDGGVVANLEPRPEDDEEDFVAVPEADRVGTMDMQTAMFLGLSDVAGSPVCQADVPVFDGRQRLDMVVERGQDDEVSVPFFEGTALRCGVEMKQISGTFGPPDDVSVPGLPGRPDADEPRTGSIWLVQFPGMPILIPVKMEMGSGLKKMSIVLEKVNGKKKPSEQVVERVGR